MNKTGIEWTDLSVNPFRARHRETGKVGWHCVKFSTGCAHCYSEALNLFRGTGLPYAARSAEMVDLFLDDGKLSEILRLKEPRRIFPCDMTDLFLDSIPAADIATFFGVMAVAGRHTFQILTKRAKRLAALLGDPGFVRSVGAAIDERVRPLIDGKIRGDWGLVSPTAAGLRRGEGWPLPNVWIGVSVEDQQRADERIPLLLQTPAAVRFLSVEPLLGPVDLDNVRWLLPDSIGVVHGGVLGDTDGRLFSPRGAEGRGIGWVIGGFESGPKARPGHPDWARSLRDQCVAAGVKFFWKQWGEWVAPGQVAGIDEDDGPRIRRGTPEIYLSRSGHAARVPGGYEPGCPCDHAPGDANLVRLGKKAAGRHLDGRTWDEMPEPTEAAR